MPESLTSSAISLPIVLKPHRDESYFGFLTRVAEANLRESAIELALLAGIDRPVLSDLQKRGTGEVELAALCGIPLEELRKRRHISVGGAHDPVHLAAGTITPYLVRTSRPRIAPATYAKIGYHRYAWDFEFLPFDSETGERLIGACPHCGTELSWARPSFRSCYSCGKSLVKGVQEQLGDDQRAICRVFSDLLSINEVDRLAARNRLAPEVRELSNEQLFRFLFEISNLFEFKKATKRQRPTEINWVSVLTRAYQIATEWPEALLVLVDESRLDAPERGGRYGLRREFGDLGVLLREWDEVAEIRAVVLPAIRSYLQLHPEIALKANSGLARGIEPNQRFANQKEIRQQYGWGHEKVKRLLEIPGVVIGSSEGSGAPQCIDRAKVAEIHDALQGLISRRTIRNIWGIPHDAVSQIVKAGIFKEVTDPFVVLVQSSEGLFKRDQVAQIFERAHQIPSNSEFDGFSMSFNKVVENLGKSDPQPWATVLTAVLEGRLKPVKLSSKQKRGFGRVRFEIEDVLRWIAEITGRGERTLSLAEVKRRIGTHMDVVYWLVEKGFLKTLAACADGRGRRVSNMEILRFEGEYVTSASLSGRYGITSNFVVESLDLLGAKPIDGIPSGRRLYRWRDIPKDFRVLSRTEIYALRNKAGKPNKPHPWRQYRVKLPTIPVGSGTR